LRHPGIVSVISVGQDRDIPYFAMEWLEGATLFEVLRCFDGRRAEDLTGEDLWSAVRDLGAREVDRAGGEPGLEMPDAFLGTWCDACLRIAQDVAETLHYSHKRGVVHRDIKPSNIWITPGGRTVLIDFGLARTSDSSQLTRTGAQLGSLLYMSPEQVAGSKAIDERTDVYSLGVTLYESLALRSPFEASSAEITVRRIVQGDTRAPRAWNPSIPRDAQTVCMKAMSRRVEDRYRGAADFARDLDNVLEQRSIAARPPGWAARVRRWTERHPARALGLLLLVAVASFAVFTAVRERRALRRIQLLADSRWIERLTIEARSFWPMDPNRLPDMQRWLDEVDEALEQHPLHQRELEELRLKAFPYSEEEERRDRAPTERTIEGLRGELRALEKFVDAAEDHQEALRINATELADLKRLISDLQRKETRSTWSFADRSDEWRHEMLTRLIDTEYRGIVALRAEVEEHGRHVREIQRESILDREEEWARAILDIAGLPLYGGLRLTPQMGLRPLRRNPQSGLWEFLHVLSGTAPAEDPSEEDAGRLRLDVGNGLVMVLVPGGTAEIGEGPSDERSDVEVSPLFLSYSRPVHTVELDPFFLSKYEMTVAQFARLGGELATNQERSLLPVLSNRNVLLEIFDRTWLMLPTEVQWEYACRAGTTTTFFTGNTLRSLVGYANIADRSQLARPGVTEANVVMFIDDGYVDEAPVGSFLPNPFGLHDTHGNAEEWTRDVFVTRGYKTMEARPGDGLRYFSRDWLEGLRFGTRGGACWSRPEYLRSAARSGNQADERWQIPGVRPMRKVRRGRGGSTPSTTVR
jgi:formylglycine-generating enzyme required for sulfatase activity